MAILILHAAVVIIYGKIMWNSIREGRAATSALSQGQQVLGAGQIRQPDERPVGN
jgi:urease gamma subunit